MSPKRDFSRIALDVVQQTTGAKPKPPAKTAKQVAGAAGGLKGGAKRMAGMTAEERREMALKGANARWGGKNENAPSPAGTGAARKG